MCGPLALACVCVCVGGWGACLGVYFHAFHKTHTHTLLCEPGDARRTSRAHQQPKPELASHQHYRLDHTGCCELARKWRAGTLFFSLFLFFFSLHVLIIQLAIIIIIIITLSFNFDVMCAAAKTLPNGTTKGSKRA
jgi:hypothetical protein